MKHLIDPAHWDRHDNWAFMQQFENSWYSVTSEVDCTKAFEAAKRDHTSFFVRYLYAMLRAANEVKEMGYRTVEGKVYWFDRIGATVPVAVPGGTFYTVLVPYEEDYTSFYEHTEKLLHDIPADGDPYGVNRQLITSGDFGVVNISATPKLYFTSMTYTFFQPHQGSHWPLMNVGKAVRREGRWVMPVGIYVDHCFVDGGNISDFINIVSEELSR